MLEQNHPLAELIRDVLQAVKVTDTASLTIWLCLQLLLSSSHFHRYP